MTAGCGDGAEDAGRAPYALWDAAYVLGSLSSDERREYESHLAVCARCRAAVAELSGVPALLTLLDREEMAAADDPPTGPPPPQDLGSLLGQVRARRRRFRWVVAGLSAAAACLAIGLMVALRPVPSAPDPAPTAAAMTMSPVGPSAYHATVTLVEQRWGTQIGVACTYTEKPGESDESDDDSDRLAMVAVGRDGSQTHLATWTAVTGATALPNASTALPLDEIAAIRVVSAESGDVLLERTL